MAMKEENPFILPSDKVQRYEPRPLEPPPPMPNEAPAEGHQNQTLTGERAKNFPPCKPLIHHNINVDIPEPKRLFVRKNWFSWFFHVFCLFFNAMCLLGGAILGQGIYVFIWACLYFVGGFFITLWIYFLIYSAIRLNSSFRFMLWFGFFGVQIIFEILCAIGIPSFGGAGLVNMAEIFTAEYLVLGIFYAISAFLWTVCALFNLVLFYQGRQEFREMGGTKAAAQDFSKTAVQTAYDNRETIKQVVVDNKDTIKQVALDNKDAIIDFAKQNKDTIKEVAWENRDTLTKIAIENKDVIYQNEDVVNSVFSKK